MWDNITAAVIKRLAAVYKPSLTSGPLRHAILTLSATYIGSMQYVEQMEFHSHKARLSLMTRLDTPNVVSEIDVLASFMLAIQAWTGPGSRHEILVHVRGCASMLRTLASKSPLSYILQVFGPLCFDYLTLLEFWVKVDPQKTFQDRCTIFGQESCFRQRSNYISKIRIDCNGTEWNSANGWAIHTTAMFLFDMAFCIFMRTKYHEEGLTMHYSQIVKAQFWDPALQEAVRNARQWQQRGPIRHSLDKSLLIRDRTLLKLELVPLLLSILDAGTDSPETISIAHDIIRTYDSRKNELSRYHLLLLGVALHHPSCVDGNIILDAH